MQVSAASGIGKANTHRAATSFEDGSGGAIYVPSIDTKNSLHYPVDFVGVAKLPLTEHTRLTGKAGVSHYEFESKTRLGAIPGSRAASYSFADSGASALLGVGAEIDFLSNTSLVAGYTFYNEQVFDSDGVDGIQLGLKRRF